MGVGVGVGVCVCLFLRACVCVCVCMSVCVVVLMFGVSEGKRVRVWEGGVHVCMRACMRAGFVMFEDLHNWKEYDNLPVRVPVRV